MQHWYVRREQTDSSSDIGRRQNAQAGAAGRWRSEAAEVIFVFSSDGTFKISQRFIYLLSTTPWELFNSIQVQGST